MAESSVLFKIRRCDGPGEAARWEEFRVPTRPGMNVITALMYIRENPVTADGRRTTPVMWESNCLEEVCGACTMLVNGRVRQSCSTLVATLDHPIVLEPMSKFPLVRDLAVDRSSMFQSLKRVKAWVPVDGTYDLGPGPRMNEADRARAYELSRCMTCGCCLEACPQISSRSSFMGAAAISQVRLFNMHPTGAMQAKERLDALMGVGGIVDCGNSQNCVEVCPKDIPLTESISEMARATTGQFIRNVFGG